MYVRLQSGISGCTCFSTGCYRYYRSNWFLEWINWFWVDDYLTLEQSQSQGPEVADNCGSALGSGPTLDFSSSVFVCVNCNTLLWINLVSPRLVACSWLHAAYGEHYTLQYIMYAVMQLNIKSRIISASGRDSKCQKGGFYVP